MAARRDKRKGWVVDFVFQHPGGRQERVRRTSPVQTRRGTEEYERQLRESMLMGRYTAGKETPTFDEWFNGRYWDEWVVGRRNKAMTVEGKKSVYKKHLKPIFGHLRLDEITVGIIARFRASLVKAGKSDKTINNVLAVLSKPLRYAADVELIPKAPKVGLFRIEAPEIVFWEFEEYGRILAAAKREGELHYAAVCLAGEAGLRVGEVKALRWREDVDMVAKTITVNQQTCRGVTGTPKGRTRRTVPMTETLYQALKSLSVVREGLVIRGMRGQAKNDENQIKNAMYRVCRLASLPERGWHCMRHSFGTHLAMFGVNPWRLMTWLGHKRIDETMRYVHIAGAHMRDTPKELLTAAEGEFDPDRRVLKMLGARCLAATSWHLNGTKEEARRNVAGFQGN